MEWIDLVRGFAVLCVIFYHVVIAFKVADEAPPVWATVINNALSPFRMPLLMFLSGLLLQRSLRKPARVFISGKLRHIAWPYFVWTTAIIVFLIGASQLAGNGNYGVDQIFSIIVDPATYTWYLAYLLAYYLISLFTRPSVRSALVPVLLVISAVAHDGDGITRFTFLYAFFLLGDLTAREFDRWHALSHHRIAQLGATVAVVSVVALSIALGSGVRYDLFTAFGVAGMAILSMPVATWISRWKPSALLMALGRDSIVYYVTHWIVVTAAVHVFSAAGLRQATLLTFALMAVGILVPTSMVHLTRRSPFVAALYVFPKRRSATAPTVSSSHVAAATRIA